MARKPRKLTQEKADAINRRRDLIEGTERSWEHDRIRVAVDEDGRGVLVDGNASGGKQEARHRREIAARKEG